MPVFKLHHSLHQTTKSEEIASKKVHYTKHSLQKNQAIQYLKHTNVDIY
jgi:hypothetical protein